MFCSKCGAKFDDEEQLFCINCGAKRPGIKIPVENMKQETSGNSVSLTKVNVEDTQVTNVTTSEEQSQESVVSADRNKPEFVQDKPAIPAGFVLDPASGWFYKSKAKQLLNGAFVNEITWFEPTTGKTAVKEYPMSEQQVRAMYGQSVQNTQMNQNTQMSQNTLMNQNTNYGQQNTYQQQQTYSQIKPKKKKTGLVIGIIIAIVVVIGLGICAWQFEWIKFGKTSGGDKIAVIETPTPSPTQIPTVTLAPTPTEVPVNPLGILNEDYIVIANQEILTTEVKLSLEYRGLTNDDLEPLKYMKYLEYLNIKGNNITSLDYLKENDTLITLDASDNDIYDINALSGLVNLESLELNNTKISDLAPLQNIKTLTNLSIIGTDVFDLSPLIYNDSLLYLYVADTMVEDFYCLSLLPNLCFCDVYDVNSNITPTPIPEISDGFTFTVADDLYFVPVTYNYVVISLSTYAYDQIILFSYDENGKLVQMRFRMDVGIEIAEEDRDLYTSSLQDELSATNFNYDGSIIYFDYPTTSEEFDISKEELIRELDMEGCEIIINSDDYSY